MYTRAQSAIDAAMLSYEGRSPVDGGKTPRAWRDYWISVAKPLEDAVARATADVDSFARKQRDMLTQSQLPATQVVVTALVLIAERAGRDRDEAEQRRASAEAELNRPSGLTSAMTVAQRVAEVRKQEVAALLRFEQSAGWATAVVRKVKALEKDQAALQREINTLVEGKACVVKGLEELRHQEYVIFCAQRRCIALRRRIAFAKQAAKRARVANPGDAGPGV